MIGFWILIGFIILVIIGGCGALFYFAHDDGNVFLQVAAAVMAIILVTLTLWTSLWWLNGTESGARTKKSWESDVSGGIDRTVTVYDVGGEVIKEYTGRFDVDYDDSRIIFDDEQGKRHVIYYTTGTVIIDEK